jgi:hypothetical protein
MHAAAARRVAGVADPWFDEESIQDPDACVRLWVPGLAP